MNDLFIYTAVFKEAMSAEAAAVGAEVSDKAAAWSTHSNTDLISITASHVGIICVLQGSLRM